MSNPWKSKPLLICATPIVGVLAQVIILGYATGTTGNARWNAVNNVVTFATLFLPAVSIPALAAAAGALKTKAMRGWSIAGVILNSAYCLLLSVPVLTLATYLMHAPRR
jgi:hypothetical protein